ncbi:MAG TPA: SCO family protein [Gaiellaceae bacterium]|jgi:cytochrome oxidase Cu insertion factor (SCO1/SenC/PrrC family)
MRWAVWLLAVLVGACVGIGAVALRSPRSAAGRPIVSGPATTWKAGVKRSPAFDLRDENGDRVSTAALRGRPLIVTFIDPLCRNYCPIEATRLEQVVRALPRASRPAIVAVSVNVQGDARRFLVQDMHKWAAGPEWHWGVGTPAELRSVWKRFDIGVVATTKKIAGIRVHEVAHTEAAYVVDANGFERALYLWPFSAADVKATLVGLGG